MRAARGGGGALRVMGRSGGEGSCLAPWLLWAGAAWCRWGGAAGGLGVPYIAICFTRPRLPGKPRGTRARLVFLGAGGSSPGRPLAAAGRDCRGLRGPGGWWSACRKGTPLPCAPVCPAPPAVPFRVSAAIVAHHGQDQGSRSSGGASSPHVLARQRFGGVCSSSGGHGLLRLGPQVVGLR